MNWHNLCSPRTAGEHECGETSTPGGPRSGQGEDMCGRYASARKRIELLEEFRVERDRVSEPLEPDYNVAPTKRVYAVVTRDARPAERGRRTASRSPAGYRPATSGVARELRVVRWGLVPFWAKDPKIGSRLINARAETVASKPAFRHAFKRRRCLLPADGYYEWQRPTARPATGRRGRRAGSGGGAGQGGGAGLGGGGRAGRGQTAVLHHPRRRRPAGLRGPVRALAGRRAAGRSRAGVAVDGHDHHHERAGRAGPDSRPDADGDRAGPLGRLARSGQPATRPTWRRCWPRRPRAG